MDWIIWFLTSSWITWIATWIISSLIVYWITYVISRKRWDKIYKEKVKNANYEFLHSIKPMIIEKSYSNKDFLDSISKSLSQKYDVEKSDLISIQDIVDHIVLEISQSYFLDNRQKQSHINELLSIKKEHQKESKKEKETEYIRRERPLNSQLSFLMASITFLYSIWFLFFSDLSGRILLFPDNRIETLLPLLFLIIVPIMATVMLQLKRSIRERENIRYNKNSFDSINNIYNEIINKRNYEALSVKTNWRISRKTK